MNLRMAAKLDTARNKLIFSRTLVRQMRLNGLSLSELARRSGLTKQVLSTYTTGFSYPNPDKFKKLADALNISVDELTPNAGAEPIGVAADQSVLEEDLLNTPRLLLAAIPDRPELLHVNIRANLPADVARRILALAAA